MKAKIAEAEEIRIQDEQVTLTLSRDGAMSDEINFQTLKLNTLFTFLSIHDLRLEGETATGAMKRSAKNACN